MPSSTHHTFGDDIMSYTSSSVLSSMPAQEIDQYVMRELRGQYALLGRPNGKKGKARGRKDRPMWRRRAKAVLAAIPVRS